MEGSGTGATSARLVPRRISSTLRSGASYLFTADQVDQIRSALAAGRRRISLMPTDVQQQLWRQEAAAEDACREDTVARVGRIRAAATRTGVLSDIRRAIAMARIPDAHLAGLLDIELELLERFREGEADLPAAAQAPAQVSRGVRPESQAQARSNRRQCRPPAGRPPTGASSCRSTTTGQSFKRQPTSCPRSTSTSSERYRTQAADAPGTANWDAVCDEARKTPPQGDARRCGEPPPDGRHAQSRPSRTVRQPEDRRGSAIDRAIPKMVARYRRMPAGATKAPRVGTVLFAVFPEDMAVSP